MSKALRLIGYGDISDAELAILEREYVREQERGLSAPRLARAIEDAKRRLWSPLPLAPAGWVANILRNIVRPTHGKPPSLEVLKRWGVWLNGTTTSSWWFR